MSDSNWIRTRLVGSDSDDSAGEGENTLSYDFGVSNAAAVITCVTAWDTDTNITRIEFILADDDGTDYIFNRVNSPGANTAVHWNGRLILEAEDYIKAQFIGCAANDDIYLYVFGYQIPQFKSQTNIANW